VEEGLAWVRRAVELAPADVEVVGLVVRGLHEVGQSEEAWQTARAALFRNSRDPRFRQLWNDFRFQQLHRRQQHAQRQRLIRRAIAEGRICLPFEPTRAKAPHGRRVRHDAPSPPAGPHVLRLGRLPDRKHA
jgi:hypothetical protein